MKIFHIISRLDVGGAERVAISIAKGHTADCSHHIVELQRGQSAFTRGLLDELKQSGIPVHRSWLPVVWHFHYLVERIISCLFPLRLLWLWLRYRPDVIHSHTEMPDMAVWLSLKIFPFIRVKLVRTIHNTCLWTSMQWVGPRVERLMQSRGANVAISQNVRQMYVERYGGPEPPIIYNGVPAVAQRQYEGIKSGKTNILFAGRFEEQKGISVLCEIVKALQDDNRYFFHIFGAGRLQREVDAIKELPNVEVLPPMNNISSVLASFDYLIMPSLHEGLPLLSVEASLNGLPLIANRCPGLVETIPAEWPLAVSNNDIGEWLQIFREVLPRAERTDLIKQAHDFAQSNFSMEQMQRSYTSIYKDSSNNI